MRGWPEATWSGDRPRRTAPASRGPRLRRSWAALVGGAAIAAVAFRCMARPRTGSHDQRGGKVHLALDPPDGDITAVTDIGERGGHATGLETVTGPPLAAHCQLTSAPPMSGPPRARAACAHPVCAVDRPRTTDCRAAKRPPDQPAKHRMADTVEVAEHRRVGEEDRVAGERRHLPPSGRRGESRPLRTSSAHLPTPRKTPWSRTAARPSRSEDWIGRTLSREGVRSSAAGPQQLVRCYPGPPTPRPPLARFRPHSKAAGCQERSRAQAKSTRE